ncbi:hypothetical protein N7541_001545 [Penicillium brevicompactum]|uniref:Uncharacterized protein n=1 Tax=Penicillium brevicompactum TaxID=5074 RepID=A0A9W9RYB7_PENBR|nr:hypothetical protein N7541_001545 [Penicillium brevicompactum]
MDTFDRPPMYGGCFYTTARQSQPIYLPQLSLKAHAIVQSSAACTTLSHTFVNSSDKLIKEASYKFPLYDGVSVVEFDCKIGTRILHSSVKAKSEANAVFETAVAKKKSAAIMDHTSQNDVFLIRLGNIPAHEQAAINITFVEELKQDAQTDGVRYTLPCAIAPRYGTQEIPSSTDISSLNLPVIKEGNQGMSVTVDVAMDESSAIREVESPSHQIKVSLGRDSSLLEDDATFNPCKASASLKNRGDSDEVFLERDFVLLIKADSLDAPCALLETHPSIPNQRAIMATLVPKFSIVTASPEVVFVIDRSGSMTENISTLQSALRVLLKSIPVGVSFNICSFGSTYSFLWPTSKIYNASSLKQAMDFVDTVDASFGGTEMEQAVVATVAKRLDNKVLEVLILTDGEIYNQQSLFDFIRGKAANNDARFFSLAIGEAASHSLTEGIARAGKGFCQSVLQHEELNRKLVRMLKGALTPHIHDYKLEVKYDGESQDVFEHVDATDLASETEDAGDGDSIMEESTVSPSQPISLFDKEFNDHDMETHLDEAKETEILPNLTQPKAIQAPYHIPPLYPMIRTTVYLLMDPQTSGKTPTSIVLSATFKQRPLSLRIPIQDIGLSKTIHQLASRKAIIELEEQSGWLSDAKDEQGASFKNLDLKTQQRLAERECQTLGIKFQITGKYCSFVAVEESSSAKSKRKRSKMHAVEIESSDSSELHTQTVQQSQHKTGGLYRAPFKCRGGGVRGGVRGGGRGGGPAPQLGCARFMDTRCESVADRGAPPMGSAACAQTAGSESRGPPLARQSHSQMQFQLFQNAAMPGGSQNVGQITLPSLEVPMNATSDPEELQELVKEQTYEGSWLMSNRLFELMKCDRKEVIKEVAELYARSFGEVPDSFPCGDQNTIVATLLVMGYLEWNLQQSEGSWLLVHAKAEEWVEVKLEDIGFTTPGRVLQDIRFQIRDLMRTRPFLHQQFTSTELLDEY